MEPQFHSKKVILAALYVGSLMGATALAASQPCLALA